ncbi:hypothetical protein CXG81DRAFT_20643 [Caulochytrium protostelioides]|uniref:Extracellular membrane protein CFEM domain-containing protein n=1 Tax=Caulochytrium protostelioides TaxID=1555241 RepID=A0A4P9X2U0_9FUNG|nr:hypothetical protein CAUPRSCDRAFT_10467 [Caulochytrium protostelioides]RKO99260.1 hypothetical protein CXG81DRAFT_20643 [Caulochytrium protostelioides]|eukprot:RKO99260.1 hypothetical protein CXG81DRAFT_20643 [Caulochytrium protostelioides]
MKSQVIIAAFAASVASTVLAIEVPENCPSAPTFNLCVSNELGADHETPEAACAPKQNNQTEWFHCLCNKYRAVSYCYANFCGAETLAAQFLGGAQQYCAAANAAKGPAEVDGTTAAAADASENGEIAGTTEPNDHDGIAMASTTGAAGATTAPSLATTNGSAAKSSAATTYQYLEKGMVPLVMALVGATHWINHGEAVAYAVNPRDAGARSGRVTVLSGQTRPAPGLPGPDGMLTVCNRIDIDQTHAPSFLWRRLIYQPVKGAPYSGA